MDRIELTMGTQLVLLQEAITWRYGLGDFRHSFLDSDKQRFKRQSHRKPNRLKFVCTDVQTAAHAIETD